MSTTTVTDCQGTWRDTYREAAGIKEVLRCSGCNAYWVFIADSNESFTVEADSFETAVNEALDRYAVAQAALIPPWDEDDDQGPESVGCECELDWLCGLHKDQLVLPGVRILDEQAWRYADEDRYF